MKKKKLYKAWEETKVDIEETLSNGIYCANDSELCLESGLQLKHTISQYPSPVFSVTFHEDQKECLEFYVINYMSADTGESKIVEWKYNPKDGSSKLSKKVTIRQCLKFLLWIQPQHAFLAYCDDMTIRGYNGFSFEEKMRLSIHSTVLCMLYIEEIDELVTGGQGNVTAWKVRMIDFGLPVEPKEPPILCDIRETREWVKRLAYDKSTNTLLVLTDETVYIVSMKTRQQIEVIHNSHDASLTYCTFYRPFSYFITAARDGTVHVYHTAAQALIHTFSAHRDGITGCMSLPNQPVLITWSQTSGSLRMWRLDTFEVASENTFSETIAFFQIPGDCRAYYQSDNLIRIFDINVLYTVFATVSSAIESFKLCSIRRHVPVKGSFKTLDSHVARKVKFSDATTSSTHMCKPLKVELNTSEPKSEEEMFSIKDQTQIDFRLICVLDDHSILGVSPVSGSVLSIIYPLPEMNKPCVGIDLEMSGRGCYLVLCDGTLMDFDCSVNPGQIGNIVKTEKRQQVLSVAAMEIYLQDDSMYKRQQGIFVGLDSGYIKLYDGGQAAQEKRLSGAGGRRRSTRRRKSTINEFGPYLKMDNVKAHAGGVNILHVPFEGSFVIDDGNQNIPVKNILLSGGTDCRVIMWRAAGAESGSPLQFDVILTKLRFVKWPEEPTCMALTNNIILSGFSTGNIEMLKLNWKSFYSSQAEIKVEHNAFILSSISKLSVDFELQHKKCVLCASESHLLQLFVTSSKDGMIKVWDCDGLLVRELMLGDVAPSVCFASGRDLLVALRNHILRIESFRYLPTDYLEKLLGAVEADKTPVLEPEIPTPLEGGADGVSSFIPQEDEEIDEDPFATVNQSRNKIDPRSQRKMSLAYAQNRRKRMMAVKRAYDEMESDDEDEEVATTASEHLLALRDTPVERIVDKAAEFIATLDADRMKRHPVAPDGFIPNSVIRDRVQPLSPAIWAIPPTRLALLREIQQKVSVLFPSQVSLSFLGYMESVATLEEQSEIVEAMLNPSDDDKFKFVKPSSYDRLVELKRYLRGRREEGKLNNLVIQDKSPRTRSRSVTPVKDAPDQPPKPAPVGPVKVSPAPAPPPKSAQSDRLSRLLAQLSRERWCPTMMGLANMEKGLLLVADVLKRTSVNICCEICSYVARILDACAEYKKAHGTNPFTDTLQKVYSEQVAQLITQNSHELQRKAAECLVGFDDVFLKNVVVHHVMSNFLQTTERDGKVFTTDDQVATTTARGVFYLSELVTVDRLVALTRLADINRLRDTRANEKPILAGVEGALKQQGVDIVEVQAWASFVLPLLTVRADYRTKRDFTSKPIRSQPSDKSLQVDVVAKRPSVVIVSEREEKKFCMETIGPDFSGSDTNLSAYKHYQSDTPSAGDAAPVKETLKTGQSAYKQQQNKLWDVDIDDQGVEMLPPVSVKQSFRRTSAYSSTGLRALEVRSKESNLRRESVQVLRVMRRSSVFRSQQDLTALSGPDEHKQRRLSTAGLGEKSTPSRSNLIRFSNMLTPSSRRISPAPSNVPHPTAASSYCACAAEELSERGVRVFVRHPYNPLSSNECDTVTSSTMTQRSDSECVYTPSDVKSLSSGYPGQMSSECFSGLSSTLVSSTALEEDGKDGDWRKILGHLRKLRLEKGDSGRSSGDSSPTNKKCRKRLSEPAYCFGRRTATRQTVLNRSTGMIVGTGHLGIA